MVQSKYKLRLTRTRWDCINTRFLNLQIYDRVISIVIGKNILYITYLSICVSAIRSLKFLISPTFCEKKNESSYGVEYTLLTANCTQRDVMTLKISSQIRRIILMISNKKLFLLNAIIALCHEMYISTVQDLFSNKMCSKS